MLLTLLYHRVNAQSKYGNAYETFKAHLEWIAKRYSVVLPGEPLNLPKQKVCLTFDDATFDFYHLVYPLLQKLGLKALLSVPVGSILEKCDLAPSERLSAAINISFQPSTLFCTWDELRDMSKSGLVTMASHSFSHVNLSLSDVDLKQEIIVSKRVLEEKVGQKVTTFVYPYGKFTKKAQEIALKHYDYVMRIGNGMNINWKNRGKLHYRINADALPSSEAPFSFWKKVGYFMKFIINTISYK